MKRDYLLLEKERSHLRWLTFQQIKINNTHIPMTVDQYPADCWSQSNRQCWLSVDQALSQHMDQVSTDMSTDNWLNCGDDFTFLKEWFSYKVVQLKRSCLPIKTTCPLSENINETPVSTEILGQHNAFNSTHDLNNVSKYFKSCSETPSQVQSVKFDPNCALISDESWRVWKNYLLCLPGRSYSAGKNNSSIKLWLNM